MGPNLPPGVLIGAVPIAPQPPAVATCSDTMLHGLEFPCRGPQTGPSREEFTVKVKPSPSNLAYHSGPLELHADLPFYEYQPGVQFLHCIVQYQGEGGDSLIADAANVARQLQQTYPEHYRVLTETRVEWSDRGTDETREFYKVQRLPMISLDQSGEIHRINLSQPQRDSYFSVPAGDVQAWYAALAAFRDLMTDPKNYIQSRMTPGTILTFDNLRILHGRTGNMSVLGERHVEGCYVDWDEVSSRRRVLETKLGPGSL
ncbi:gamma-butyrobetaine dioxygenase-like [Eriocheir sinensis]|uniref:gamma-butyrobetaine dioxygenase-like n=1 Tax=Eriocheir sinensis TaxID=95602 RepID=UPI0021C9FD9B|nr:gamma-butyrobetaine dioxygenase-like [Eriocheir sinensis]